MAIEAKAKEALRELYRSFPNEPEALTARLERAFRAFSKRARADFVAMLKDIEREFAEAGEDDQEGRGHGARP